MSVNDIPAALGAAAELKLGSAGSARPRPRHPRSAGCCGRIEAAEDLDGWSADTKIPAALGAAAELKLYPEYLTAKANDVNFIPAALGAAAELKLYRFVSYN